MGKTFVICEGGSCHDGDLQKAIRLVHAAADCGGDAIKFQWVSSPERLAERRNAGEYVKHYKLISFPRGWFDVLRAEADRCGVEFMTTTYLIEDIPIVAPYVSRFKVASFEADDETFVRAHQGYDKQVIVSYSGGTRQQFAFGNQYKSLLCVSAYPCPIDALNLIRLRQQYRSIGDVMVGQTGFPFDGLSDHTTSTLTGALAVAAGATIIEKHFRLHDTDPANADYAHSLVAVSHRANCQNNDKDEADFEDYVSNIRLAEQAMGDGRAGPMPCEEAMMKFKVKA